MVAALVRCWRAWEEFLFAPVDARSLAWLRIAFGAYLLWYYVDLFSFLSLHFLPPALLPPPALASGSGVMLIKYVHYAAAPRLALYALTLAAAFALMAGFQTRLAATLCWVLHQSWLSMAAGRNSGDNVVSVTSFLLMVAALAGHAQSVLAFDAPTRFRLDPPRYIFAWTSRLFQIQLVFIYLFTGFHKCASNVWYRGEALYYVFQQPVWSRHDLTWLVNPIVIGLLTYGTLLFEALLFPVLVWPKSTRHWVLLAGVLFHLGISLSMRVFVFGEIMPLLYLSFVDGPMIEGKLRALIEKTRALGGALIFR